MRGQVSGILSAYGNVDNELIVPVYQRNYDWKSKHCKQLLDDLKALITEDRPKHFFGSVVGDPESKFRWIVIDGQQRLTTTSLLLLALVRLMENGTLPSSEPDLAAKIKRNYLVRDEDATQPRFRLKPVKDDADAYRRLFRSEDDFVESSTITRNFRFFLEQLPLMGLTADQLWKAIQGLEVMVLDLEKHDDAQRIFESLNSTGLALSEADKVRNLVLMGLPSAKQEAVYNDYWNRLEKNVDFETSTFLRWYLVTKTTKTPKVSDVYDAFKEYAQKLGTTGEELLKPIHQYSEYYRQLLSADTPSDIVNRRLERLNILGREVILPLLMPMMEDFEAGHIDAEDFAASLKVIETYLFRRTVVGQPAAALNKIFAALYREVKRQRTDEARFTDVLVYSLRRRSTSGAFPSDEDFIEGFRTANFYRILSPTRRYLFESLENGDSKDTREIAAKLDSGDLTVEHIMPQTLTSEWKKELGPDFEDVHARWVHRIGNLTVTGYNSKYSNASFAAKKTIDGGFDVSPYRLNEDIKSATHWTEQEMEARTQRLTDFALKYWPMPSTDFDPPQPQHPVEPMGFDTDFTGRAIVAYEFNGVRSTVGSWREFAGKLIRQLGEIDEQKVRAIAALSDYFWDSVGIGNVTAAKRKELEEVMPGLYWNLSTSTYAKIAQLRRFFDGMGIDPEEVALTIRHSAEDDSQIEDIAEPSGPYADLVKFVPRFEQLSNAEAQGTATSTDDTEVTELIEEFHELFTPHFITTPAKVLGTAPRRFVKDSAKMESVSPDQVLALISGIVIETQALDPDALTDAARDGSLAGLLKKLPS